MPVHHPHDAASAVRKSRSHRPLGVRRGERHGPHRSLTGRERDCRRAGLCRFSRQDCEWSCRRSPVDVDARTRLSALRCPRDESPDVGERGESAQRGPARRRRRRDTGAWCGRPGVRRDRRGQDAGTRGDIRRGRRLGPTQSACWQACVDHGRADVRGDRPGARYHQHKLRQDGLRDRTSGGGSRGDRDTGCGADGADRDRRCRAHRRRERG